MNRMAVKTLTAKQQAFVNEYLIDLNATQAAIRAGYSSKTAAQIAHELLDKTLVAAAINEALAKRTEKAEIDALWVLNEATDLYKACRDADKLSDANTALKLVGSHVNVQAFKERVAQEHSFTPEAAKWLGR